MLVNVITTHPALLPGICKSPCSSLSFTTHTPSVTGSQQIPLQNTKPVFFLPLLVWLLQFLCIISMFKQHHCKSLLTELPVTSRAIHTVAEIEHLTPLLKIFPGFSVVYKVKSKHGGQSPACSGPAPLSNLISHHKHLALCTLTSPSD